MWWILSGLLVLIAWALWFVLRLAAYPDLGIWIPIVATSAMVLLGIVLFVVRRIRARRAATALEQAIANQGAQQAMNARPERRAEIQELQKQIQSGIAALKTSKLGRGAKGAAALYQLPWYVIIGPPGAGKTTALKHSGLVFPYANPSSGGGVRGVGGTRNCDWWFTNEAILLDTAGRYATEADDREEWIAFLHMLRRYRSRRPINGILVAISVTDLIDANEQQIDTIGKKLRARIDEVMTELHMVVPVYVLFTKVDLIAGFNEFFGDLKKSERAQAWGATFRLDAPKNEPGRLFDVEFDALVKQLHARALKRLATERNRDAREKIYQFPLEFAAIKRNLSDLVGTLFMVNAFQGTPILRGFYFTSGTQEGRPLDRVLARMGQAMGIRTAEAAVQQVVESKSYFLHDVFMNVVFPDGDIAARSESEVRRQALMRVAISAAALLLGIIVSVPGVVSFFANRQFLIETEERAKAAAAIAWSDGRPPGQKLEQLTPLLERLLEVDRHREEGVPFSMGWFMYSGDEVERPAIAVYVDKVQQGFVVPCKQRLEERLKVVRGEAYLRERTDLKTYLMLGDVEHLDVDWATGRYVALWAEILRPTSNAPEAELKKQIEPHVRYYFTLLKEARVTPVPISRELVERVQKTLQTVPVSKRFYDQFVNSLIDEKYDEAGDNTRANKKYPPLTLADVFVDRPEVLKIVTSAQFAKEKRWKEVEGPYTEKGHYAVVSNIADGGGFLEREAWVVPLSADERGDKLAANLNVLADQYDATYASQWTEFLKDVSVQSPGSVKEAIEHYATLTRADWPYLRILRAVEDGTQWKRVPSILENEKLQKLGKRKIEEKIMQTTQLRVNVDLKKVGEKVSNVPATFRKLVEFGVPSETRAGGATAPLSETPLAKYVSILEGLRADMQKVEDSTPNVDARVLSEKVVEAVGKVDAMLQPLDPLAQTILGPLLRRPLTLPGILLPQGPNRFAAQPRFGTPGRPGFPPPQPFRP